MKNIKYKILLLSDLKDSTESILKSTVSFSKLINADIELFHVKKPTDVVERDNQLSAMRAINKEYVLIDKKLQYLLDATFNDYNIKVNYSFTFGNLKKEISNKIEESKPDIIVLGKQKSKSLSFMGDNLIDFIFKNHTGTIMIPAGDTLKPNNELSLGFLNNSGEINNIAFSENLLANTRKPLKSFKIVEKSSEFEVESNALNKKTVNYVFNKDDNSLKNLSKYLNKTDVNLLCLDRGENTTNHKNKSLSSDLKKVINTINVSLLVSNSKQPLNI